MKVTPKLSVLALHIKTALEILTSYEFILLLLNKYDYYFQYDRRFLLSENVILSDNFSLLS